MHFALDNKLLPRDLFRSFENARAQYEQNLQHVTLHLKCLLSLVLGSCIIGRYQNHFAYA